MRHEPHVEFIPFPDPQPAHEPELEHQPEPEPQPEDAPVPTVEVSADDHVVPDQVLAPDEPVVLLAEGEQAPEGQADGPAAHLGVDGGDATEDELPERDERTAEPVEAVVTDGLVDAPVDDAGPPGVDATSDDAAIEVDVIDVRGQDTNELHDDTHVEPSDERAADDQPPDDQPPDDPEAAVQSPTLPPAIVRSAESAGSIMAARRSAGRRHTDMAALPPEPEIAEPDRGSFRRWGISGRMLFLPMAAIVVSVLMALVATLGIGSITHEAQQLAAAGSATDNASELRVLLAEVRDSKGRIESDRLDEVADSATRTAAAVAGKVDASRVDDLVAAVDRVVQASSDGAGEVEVEAQAITAIGAVDGVAQRIASSREEQIDRLDRRRALTIVAMLVVLIVGSAAMLALTRSVTASMVGPLRALGRTMRRFADGDTSARGAEGVDEVGLLARSFNYSASAMGLRIDRLSADAARGAQLRMISDALDLADDESDVHRIAERALGIVAPGHAAEVMVHDATSTRLVEVAASPQFGSPGCAVETSAGCVAMRRAQAVVFDSPASINSCPYLRDRENPCAAACVPVSVNGHLLGVVHVTGPEYGPPTPETVEQLTTLGGQIGTRIGAMRTLEVSRLQASTDGLTGLANRRMLEARLADFMRTDTPFVLAVADLDRFTEINNNYGHEFGDRALQLFAGVLEENVRDRDIVARFGGEEFVLVYPQMSVKPSMEAIERIRGALSRALQRHDFPEFTCSFGVTHSSVGDSVEAIIRVADAGLLTAKELGRNRVVYADEDLAVGVFGSGGEGGRSASRAFSSMRPSVTEEGSPTPGPV